MEAQNGQRNRQTKDVVGGRQADVAGLVAAAAGIAIQIASGADYPTVPPGLILVLAAAGLVAGLAATWRSYRHRTNT
jgi:hypothetical protein